MRTQNIIATTGCVAVAIAFVIFAACNSNDCDIPDLDFEGHAEVAYQNGTKNPEGDLWRCHIRAAWDKLEEQTVSAIDLAREGIDEYDFYGYEKHLETVELELPGD